MATSVENSSVEKSDRRYRNLCLTLNNFTPVEYADFKVGAMKSCSYAICAKEHVDGVGTPHLQIYVEFKEGKTFSAVKKCLKSNRYHIEVYYV